MAGDSDVVYASGLTHIVLLRISVIFRSDDVDDSVH
jgi:hypothetical protein